jgi:XXXCH domain-containing protein
MADKIEKEFSRNEIADYLETMAAQLRAGALSSGKGLWTVPEKFWAKIQLKEKKGHLELKFNCRWSTLGDYTKQDRDQINDWRASMKTVKERMGSSFKEVLKASEQGVFPADRPMEDFVATSRIFAAAADPEWRDAMDEYMDHLENFIRAVAEQQLESMRHEVRDLQYRMKACHKEFK